MKINNKILIIAVALGIITSCILYFYISDIKNAEVAPVPMTSVVAAVNTIPIHVKITDEMVAIVSVPTSTVRPDMIVNKKDIVGGITNAEIIKGEILISERVIMDTTGSPLSYRIPENMRAITVAMDEVSGVGGYIAVGDKVDILVYYTDAALNPKNEVMTLFQNIEVLEMGPNSTEKSGTGVSSSLTFLVTPDQAEQINFARLNARISFSLRNNVDNTIVK